MLKVSLNFVQKFFNFKNFILQFASVIVVIAISSSINAGIVHSPLAYTVPAAYSSPLIASPYLARSAPFIHAASPYLHAAPAPLLKAAPYIHSAPLLAKAAPLVSVRSILPVGAPVIKTVDHDAYPQYQFGYSVNDQFTGDNKAHTEFRDGDIVKGEYSLVQPDGILRKVNYYGEFAAAAAAMVQS
jgi:hypothetical protein